jgi:prepilin-type N-terminal cleavage/methylation domain-containing protein
MRNNPGIRNANETLSHRRGFSLLELMIVVAIILIIAAAAIPSLTGTKMTTNEAAVIEDLKALVTDCATYENIYHGYPGALGNLGPAAAGNPASAASAGFIDSGMATGTKSGYQFNYLPGATDASGHVLSYSITAQPISVGKTGQRFFFTDESGVVRANPSGPADATSPSI